MGHLSIRDRRRISENQTMLQEFTATEFLIVLDRPQSS